MNKETILQSNLLDIIFDNRNKAYGAYILRKYYYNRMWLAILFTIGLSVLACLLIPFSKGNSAASPVRNIFTADKTITEFHSPASQGSKSVAKVARRMTVHKNSGPPRIVAVNNINNLPATLPSILPSSLQLTGPEVNFPSGSDERDHGKGKLENVEKAVIVPSKPARAVVLEDAETMPQYPGGIKALLAFLKKNLHSPDLVETGEEITVKVQFVVNAGGKLEGFDVIKSGGEEFDNEVVRALRKMPSWIPGKSNGKNVSVYYVVPVKFKNEF